MSHFYQENMFASNRDLHSVSQAHYFIQDKANCRAGFVATDSDSSHHDLQYCADSGTTPLREFLHDNNSQLPGCFEHCECNHHGWRL